MALGASDGRRGESLPVVDVVVKCGPRVFRMGVWNAGDAEQRLELADQADLCVVETLFPDVGLGHGRSRGDQASNADRPRVATLCVRRW